jgi:Fe2+ or Zn2+ uptake regulation protein
MQQKFDLWSKILGISVDKVKNYWAQGKNLNDMIKAENLNLTDVQNRMKQIGLDNVRQNLQKLVDSGIITQDQMNQRLEFMQNNSLNFGMMHFGHRFQR